MHPTRFRRSRLAEIARRNRQELVAAGLTRRDLLGLGLLTSSGYLVAKRGLSADSGCDPGECHLGCSPPTIAFVDPLPLLPLLPERPLSDPGFAIPPTQQPSGAPQDARTESHQFRERFPPDKFFITRMRPNFNFRFSENATNLSRIGPQLIWGFNLGGAEATDVARLPGPTIVVRYGSPVVVRRFNELTTDTRGFGVPEVSTHLHNFHSAPDSDGGPCDPRSHVSSESAVLRLLPHVGPRRLRYTRIPGTGGDIRETLGTLWYHDHRVDHTAENIYKGLAGVQIAFNDFDTGDEDTGFRLPRFPQFDIPLFLADKLFTPEGEICFDPFGFDGLIGDKYIVNGSLQPYLEVQKRRYRFRILDGGPSRFYQLFLTNPDNLSQSIPFWEISSTATSFLGRSRSPARACPSPNGWTSSSTSGRSADRFGSPSRIRLENRLEQVNGRGPTGKIFAGRRSPTGHGVPADRTGCASRRQLRP